MIPFSPKTMIFIGLALLIIGFVLPFAMVMRALESTLFLGFFAYISSTLGLIIAIIGLVLYSTSRPRDED